MFLYIDIIISVIIYFNIRSQFRIEIQYRHLLTLWQNRQWHLKQTLSSSEVVTNLKVLKSSDISKVNCFSLGLKYYQQLLLIANEPKYSSVVL